MAALAENTPYDDAFKTVIHDCSSLLVPFVNEVFGEHFSGNARVSFSSNEHFLNRQEGFQEKRISDAIFTVTEMLSCTHTADSRNGPEISARRYHCECQSDADNSILIRLFEYHSQAALDDAVIKNGELTVSFPYSAVLYLRYPQSAPDTLKISIQTPGGSVSYNVAVLKLRDYTLDMIFEKRLLLLIPFYIFHYDRQLAVIDADPDRVAEIKETYQYIRSKLEDLKNEGVITEFVKVTLIDMTQKVARNFAANFANVKKGVGDVMGGRILETEARNILYQGRTEGLTKGRAEGLTKGRTEGRILEYIDIRREDGRTDDEIISDVMKRFSLSKEEAGEFVLAPAAIT